MRAVTGHAYLKEEPIFKTAHRIVLDPKWQDIICTQDHTHTPPTKTLPVCDSHTATLCSPPKKH